MQVSCFNYLECNKQDDINLKLNKPQHVWGIITQITETKTTEEKQLKFYNLVAIPVIM
jgi:hypothetical protein